MSQIITINSINYDGELANVLFTPDNDPVVINLGDVTLPFVFEPSLLTPPREVYGTYTIYTYEDKCTNILQVPRPTPTPTPTITPTRTATPTPTPTPTVTPTFVPCASPTPTPTTTVTPTPTRTPRPTTTVTPTPTITVTPTPTLTPTPSPLPNLYAYLFIEPISGSSAIGSYMYSNGSDFFGFTNASQPSQSQVPFSNDMNLYMNYPGWVNGQFPSIKIQSIPQQSGGVDSFGNPIAAYNFFTTEIPANTVKTAAWYTWIIPNIAINDEIQTEIYINSMGNPTQQESVGTEPTIYSYVVNYTGTTIPAGIYRVYTTFPNQIFRLNNNNNIYFRGSDTQP
jgi:hypothetical protein